MHIAFSPRKPWMGIAGGRIPLKPTMPVSRRTSSLSTVSAPVLGLTTHCTPGQLQYGVLAHADHALMPWLAIMTRVSMKAFKIMSQTEARVSMKAFKIMSQTEARVSMKAFKISSACSCGSVLLVTSTTLSAATGVCRNLTALITIADFE
jgi:hypothetical protein